MSAVVARRGTSYAPAPAPAQCGYNGHALSLSWLCVLCCCPEFCALLEHLDIRLLEDKRRKLFALIDKSADGHIGYQEFQVGAAARLA